AAAALAACATTPPPYVAATGPHAVGYSDTQIESDRFSVNYRADGPADASLVSDYALLHAAEVTLAHGGDWFWVDRREVDTTHGRYGGPTIGLGLGGASFGSHSAVGMGVGFNFPIGGHSGAQATGATLEIRVGHGPKPDAENAYDAHATQSNLRARL